MLDVGVAGSELIGSVGFIFDPKPNQPEVKDSTADCSDRVRCMEGKDAEI